MSFFCEVFGFFSGFTGKLSNKTFLKEFPQKLFPILFFSSNEFEINVFLLKRLLFCGICKVIFFFNDIIGVICWEIAFIDGFFFKLLSIADWRNNLFLREILS